MAITPTDLFLIVFSPACAMLIAYALSTSSIKKSLNTNPGIFDKIEPLRGVAAALVVIHHSFYSYNLTYNARWAPLHAGLTDIPQPLINIIASFGGVGVIIFFMITGFLFVDKAVKCDGQIDFKKFYIGRFFRIVPAYIFVVIFVIAVAILTGARIYQSYSDYISAVFSWLLFGLAKPYTISSHIDNYLIVAGVFWTLGVEWKFYFLYPLICQFSKIKTATVALVLSAVMVSFLMIIGFFEGINGGILLSFIFGGLAALTLRFSMIIRSYLKNSLVSAFGFSISLYCIYIGMDVYSLFPCLGLFIAFVSMSNGASVFGILNLKVFRWMGAISYSLYLSHGVFYFLFNKILINNHEYLAPSALAVLFAVAFSVVSYHFVEVKGISFGRNLSNKTKKSDLVSETTY
ncbi:acyltransferase family protein [Enterobacter kobei]|uniref:acyltransferase family protein n=1 Tax=Enterobacter kobei TaxID=208224 RepID=UPI002004A13E|nr:acyltransferase [Enterobacter kobei]MCK7022113.1 acyltransferase [Enterobacter kobei]